MDVHSKQSDATTSEALTEARKVEGSKQAAHGLLSIESVLTRRDTFVDVWNDDKLTNVFHQN